MNRLLSIIISLTMIATVTASAQQSASTSAQTRSQSSALNKSRGGVIEGRVVSDDGQPLIKVQVYANAIGKASGVRRTTGTDEEGKFVLDELATGAYSILVSTPGYVPTEDQVSQRYYRTGDSATFTMTKGGVITGTVTRSTGEPAVLVQVTALRVRDIEGRPLRRPVASGSRYTDDRGVYRIYGLTPGSYQVAANASQMQGSMGLFMPGLGAEYEDNTPTYYPSATRDTAAEVTIERGLEATGIDIQYRGERGRSISGVVAGAISEDMRSGSVSLTLTHAASGFLEGRVAVSIQGDNRSFAFHGVPDGEYDLIAQSYMQSGEGAASPIQKISVRGADVTGLTVKLVPLGSVAGRVVLEPQKGKDLPAECKNKRAVSLEETVVRARFDQKKNSKDQLHPALSLFTNSAPDAQGEFLLSRLYEGRYRIETELPGKNWYVRSITSPGPNRRLIDLAREGIGLKSGERVKDVTVTLAEGAASLSGRVVPAAEDDRLPDRLRVHMIPGEKERADDALGFAETAVRRDGTFAFNNIAPGRYRLVARPVPDEEPIDRFPSPLAWDAEGRAMLRREAIEEEIEMQPCRSLTDHILRYKPAPPQNKAATKKGG